jgi:uncharacterized membrane protein
MPLHALLGHVGLIGAPTLSVLVLLYVWRAGNREALRVPILALSVVNFAMLLWTEYSGTALLKTLDAASSANGAVLPDTARLHADLGETLAIIGFVLMLAVIVAVWRRRALGRLAAGILVASAAATLAVSAATLMLGLESVWAQHALY